MNANEQPLGSVSTMTVAEFMLHDGGFFTAATLSKAMNIDLTTASGKLSNIRNCKKYQTVTEGTPVKTKVVDIGGRQAMNSVWMKLLSSNWGG